MQQKKRWYWMIGGVTLLAIAAVLLLNGRSQQAQAAPETGEIVTAFIGDLSASATASGQALPRREASLSVETPGQVEQVMVRVGDAVQAGDALVQLDTTNLALNIASAEQTLRLKEANLAGLLEAPQAVDIAAAETAVASAQANLDNLLAGPMETDLAVSEATLRASQASLSSAAAELAKAQDSVSETQIQAAQAAVLAAQMSQERAAEANEDNPTEATHQALLAANQSLASAQAQLDTLLAGPDTAVAQNSVSAAAARVDGNQANLNLLVNGSTAAQIASAESQLAQAQATLASLLDGPTAEQIAIAEAEVEQARLSLADAEAALAEATIVAPFDGMVTAVHVHEGDFAGGVVIEMVDLDSLELILEVDEVDIGALAIGQPATITLETWPDAEIGGAITTIAPSAKTSPGSALVTYEVHLSLGQTDLPVRAGMTANASLITSEKTGILLVPNQAINADREAGAYSVTLVTGDTTQELPVTIGLRDGQYTQITDGLNAGDALLVGNALPTSSFDGGGPFAR